jgi:hypothetical protein
MTSFVLFVPMRFIYLLFWYVILIWILLFERSFVQQYINSDDIKQFQMCWRYMISPR